MRIEDTADLFRPRRREHAPKFRAFLTRQKSFLFDSIHARKSIRIDLSDSIRQLIRPIHSVTLTVLLCYSKGPTAEQSEKLITVLIVLEQSVTLKNVVSVVNVVPVFVVESNGPNF